MRIIEGRIWRVRCAVGRAGMPLLTIEANTADEADAAAYKHWRGPAKNRRVEIRVVSMELVDLDAPPADAPAPPPVEPEPETIEG